MRDRAGMRGLPLAAFSLAVVLTLVACSPPPAPPSRPRGPKAGVAKPIANPKPEDAAQVKSLLGESIPSAPDTMPVDVRSLPDIATARKRFAPLLVPADTLGRRLVGIVHFQTLGKVPHPREKLTLVYEGGLLVEETLSSAQVPIPRHPPGRPSQQETQVGDVVGFVQTLQLNSPGPPAVRVTFESGGIVYRVFARGVTPDELVRIARSMR